MHCGHVAVHADASHEADAHVDVGKIQRPRDETGKFSEHPVVPVEVVVDPEGQRAEDEDVRHGQVADVDTEGRARTGLYGEDKQRRQISWQAYD